MPRLPFMLPARSARPARSPQPTFADATPASPRTAPRRDAGAAPSRRVDKRPYLATEQLLGRDDAAPGLYPERVPVLDVTPEELDAIRAEMEGAVAEIAGGSLYDEHTAPVVAGLARTAFDRADAQLAVRFRRAERLIAGEERVVVAYRSGLMRELERLAGTAQAEQLVSRAEGEAAHAAQGPETAAEAALTGADPVRSIDAAAATASNPFAPAEDVLAPTATRAFDGGAANPDGMAFSPWYGIAPSAEASAANASAARPGGPR